jgi:hypothetical protein
VEILNAALMTCKIYNDEFTILGIAKAFNTIPHTILEPCLRRKGIPAPIINLINDMYNGCTTNISIGKNEGVEVKMLNKEILSLRSYSMPA